MATPSRQVMREKMKLNTLFIDKYVPAKEISKLNHIFWSLEVKECSRKYLIFWTTEFNECYKMKKLKKQLPLLVSI